jgi:hypothetical protein
MARARARLLPTVLAFAAACGRPDNDAAAGGRSDSAQQAAAVPAVRDTARAREDVLRLQNEVVQGWVRGDRAPAERILAEEYVGVGVDGSRVTKAQEVANARRDSAAGFALEGARLDTATARVYDDVAVAHATGTLRGRMGAQPFTHRFRTTDVFVWRDGRWQAVSSHSTRIAEPEGPRDGSRSP